MQNKYTTTFLNVHVSMKTYTEIHITKKLVHIHLYVLYYIKQLVP